MATAADWMSGASFVAMAGGDFTLKVMAIWHFLVGWTGGYVLVASLLAPYLRKIWMFITVSRFLSVLDMVVTLQDYQQY